MPIFTVRATSASVIWANHFKRVSLQRNFIWAIPEYNEGHFSNGYTLAIPISATTIWAIVLLTFSAADTFLMYIIFCMINVGNSTPFAAQIRRVFTHFWTSESIVVNLQS